MSRSSIHVHGVGRKVAVVVAFVAAIVLALPLGAGANPGRAPLHSGAQSRFAHTLWHPSKQVYARGLSRATMSTILTSVDLSRWDPTPGYQGSLGSCVTWAIDYGLLAWHQSHDRGQPGVLFNPMYTFAQVKQPDGKGGYWAPPLATLSVAQQQGNDTQADDPGSVTDPYTLPTAAMKANALNYRITTPQTLFANANDAGGGVNGMNLIKNELSAGRPVSIGMLLPADFNSMYGKSYESNLAYLQPLGAHEMMADGYDSNGLWVLNSWGSSFGINGRIQLSWAVVQQDVFEAYSFTGFAASVDTTPPVMSAVTESVAPGKSITSSTVPVSFNWSASDASGIAQYAVFVKTDAGQFVQDTTLSATATGVTYNLTLGHTYQLAVEAKDGAGNWSQFAYSISTTPSLTDDRSFSTPSPWARYFDDAGAYNGSYIGTTAGGQTLTFNYVGHDAAMISPLSSLAGQGAVYCDNVYSGTLNEYAASVINNRIVASCRSTVGGSHTMQIVTSGTAGHPWVMMDAFAVLS